MFRTRKAKKLLRNARALLADNEWIQGDSIRHFEDGRVGYCLIGAMLEADGGKEHEVFAQAENRFLQRNGIHGFGIAGFNDGVCKTKADALAALDKAI